MRGKRGGTNGVVRDSSTGSNVLQLRSYRKAEPTGDRDDAESEEGKRVHIGVHEHSQHDGEPSTCDIRVETPERGLGLIDDLDEMPFLMLKGYEAGDKFMDAYEASTKVIGLDGSPIHRFEIPARDNEDFVRGFNAAIHDRIEEVEEFDYLELMSAVLAYGRTLGG